MFYTLCGYLVRLSLTLVGAFCISNKSSFYFLETRGDRKKMRVNKMEEDQKKEKERMGKNERFI